MKVTLFIKGQRYEPHLLDNEATRLAADFEHHVDKRTNGVEPIQARYYLKPEQVGAYVLLNLEDLDAIEVHP